MAARLSCIFFLLKEAHNEDNLRKKRELKMIRNLKLMNNDKHFIDNFRLTEDLINVLEQDLTPYLPQKKRQGGISNRNKILCALAFLASGSYQKSIAANVHSCMSQPSASRIIKTVVCALSHPNIIRKYIKFPQNIQERNILKKRYFEKFGIPGVIGCVDGTLVAMVRPKEHEERYYCRKGYHARNALIFNDADLNITHFDVTFGGCTNDSHIFNQTSVKDHLEQLVNTGETAMLLGDSAFALRPYMMIPYSNPEPGSREELFNKFQTTARNTAERTYGVLKGRFRCLLVHRVLHYDPTMVSKIIMACCVLHNICNRAGLPAMELPAQLQRREAQVLSLLQGQRSAEIIVDSLESGRVARDRLANRLWRSNM